ncbi:hypothetical protein D3C72_1355080 [compost metagenome]
MLGQGFVDGVVALLLGLRQVDELLGPPVVLPLFVVHDALAQRIVGHFLVAGDQGGVDVQAACVGFATVLRKDQLACHFGHIFGMHLVVGVAGTDTQLLGAGFVGLRLGDEAVFFHPVDDVELAHFGTSGVADWVVGRWRLGQAGQHGRFSYGYVLERLAEIRL